MNILYVALKVFRQFLRDRRTLALIFVIPVVVMSLFFFMFQGDLSLKIKLAIVAPDREETVYKAFIETLQSQENLSVTEDVGPSAAEALTRTNADAVIEFPAGFFSSLAANESTHFTLLVEGTKNGIEAAAKKLADAALTKARFQSLPIFSFVGGSLSSGTIADVSYHYKTQGFRLIDLTAPGFIAFFLYFISFLLTCVAFLRERSSGTLERILISPLSSVSLILGYLLAFFVLGSVQGAFLMVFSTWILGIKSVVGIFWALLPMLVTVLLGVTMGIFFSELAKNEFQVIQFIPLVIIPQTLLSGIIFDVGALPSVFQWIAAAMPLTYTNNILKGMLLKGQSVGALGWDFLALGGFLVAFTLLSFGVARKTR
jgi:ABC-2 type transport system permease protein